MRWIAAVTTLLIGLNPVAGIGQDAAGMSEWQVQKCQTYQQAWNKALDFFGTDNLNYNFIAQNENFITSGCTAPAAVCAQSMQELDIANALTIAMMNAGAASTFLPFRCQESGASTVDIVNTAPDSELCRSQIDVLRRGDKLTPEDAAMFEAQCACLEQREKNGAKTECTQ